MKPRAAIVGVGATSFYRRGASEPRPLLELVGEAILRALTDAGLSVSDIDGFAYFAGGFDTPSIMEMLGVPGITFTAALTGYGGGSAGCIGLAASAIAAGDARTIVCVGATQQSRRRFGAVAAQYEGTPQSAFHEHAGLVSPGQMFALLARRHMHEFGTTREHFAMVALNARANAQTNSEAAMHGRPMTREDYFAAPMIADPHCLFDFCLENDGAVATVVTSVERARDLRQQPVQVLGAVHGGARDWGRAIYWMNMPDGCFARSGHSALAAELYGRAGIGPADLDVAQIYDHFTSQVLIQLEDYGLCAKGEGGPFVASGAIARGGALPVNTDGGQLSCGFIWGMTHVREAVLQLRHTAANQIAGAELALVTGGPSSLPVSGLILGRAP
ncbi:MAG: thiolase [Gammaproteobacteria bacterium]|nr:thiolase [Gammaproteobacteria bacterium]